MKYSSQLTDIGSRLFLLYRKCILPLAVDCGPSTLSVDRRVWTFFRKPSTVPDMSGP